MIFIDGIIYNLQKAGGISVYFSEIIKRLIKYEFNDFFLLLSYNSNKTFTDYSLNSCPVTANESRFLAIRRYLDVKLPENATVFHSSYYRIPVRSVRDNVTVITTVHDFTYEKWFGGVKGKIHHWQKKRAVLNSDVIVCISENTKKDLFHYIPETKNMDVRVIYNGVSDDFHKVQLDSDKQLGEEKFVLFVGARNGYKNFLMLVSAMAELSELNLLIIGGGELTGREVEMLNSNMACRYTHKSFVSNYELNMLYNKAHCLVYPSLYEGFGIPALEAMKAGCPVIASNSSSLPEVCGDAAILLDDISADSIKESIESLFTKNVRDELISQGSINAKRFSWDNTFKQLNQIYLGL